MSLHSATRPSALALLVSLLLLPGCFLRSSITVRNQSHETIETVRIVVTTLGGPVEREKELLLAPGIDHEWKLPAFTGEGELEVDVETSSGTRHAECGRVELHSYHFFVVLYDDGLRCAFDD